jgi:hypothetical protein
MLLPISGNVSIELHAFGQHLNAAPSSLTGLQQIFAFDFSAVFHLLLRNSCVILFY